MALAQTRTLVLGSFAFSVFWILATFPSFKVLPIGRTAGAIVGASLTVVFQVDSPTQAYDSVDLKILGLLFGTMVVSVYLERADMFQYLGDALSWKSRGGKDLICRVCVLSAVSSALFTNDTSCLVFTEFVLNLCRRKNLPAKPFLIALASSANIGSVATPIGNPQNLVIAVQSEISFGQFLLGLLPPMVLGVFVNTLLLLLIYWKQLSPTADSQEAAGNSGLAGEGKDQASASPWAPFDSARLRSSREILSEIPSADVPESYASLPLGDTMTEHTEENMNDSVADRDWTIENAGRLQAAEGEEYVPLLVPFTHKAPALKQDIAIRNQRSTPLLNVQKTTANHKWLRKICVYAVTAGMLAALLYGLDLSWSALTAATALMVLDFQDAGPSLDKVSYPLLVFFAGMFVTVDGFNMTGIPGTFWDAVEPYARINSASGIAVLTLVIIVLSNVASNVPTVLLLGSRVSVSAALSGSSVTKSWLILAWTSTVAGNLTLVGSAANLIVSEQARKSESLGYDLTFWNHLMFGVPSTLIVVAVGLPLIRG